MDIELLLAMENAEHYNEQKRLSKNSLLRKQRNVNLTEGLLPYVEETKSAANCISSNSKISASTATIHTHHNNYDVDFDLILTGTCVESTEINDSSNDDEDESDENLILSNEIISSKNQQNLLPLHPYTNLSTNEFCTNLIRVIRKANLCKEYSSDLLKLIHLALPQPNTLPTSLNALLKHIPVENLFIKRRVCITCQLDNEYTASSCVKCKSKDKTQFADIYDVNCSSIFSDIVEQRMVDIDKYREMIYHEENDEINNDIPFQKVYRSFLKNIAREPFISTIIHLDGIPLGKSSKLTLWVLSCSILEFPPQLRNQRKNMIILSLWIGIQQPIIKLWLRECIGNLVRIKSIGFIVGGQKWSLYFLGIIADCPAMKLALNHIGNNGYHCCWFCKIEGIHTNKRQYHFEPFPHMRTVQSYINESKEAEIKMVNINGHLGMSYFHKILDIPLPHSILMDFMHVTLLRHTRCVALQMYESITPSQRLDIDNEMKLQQFPHSFNRKLKPIKSGYVKASEIKNLLLYALLPLFYEYIPVDKAAHIALFICAIRMLHGSKLFGPQTGAFAHQLFTTYYKDHSKYYDGLENLVLHLHAHYSMQYENYGSLNNTSCFGQEGLLGVIVKNKHGTTHWGELLIDFALQKQNDQQSVDKLRHIEDVFDISNTSVKNVENLVTWHENVCGCNVITKCIIMYYRCIIRSRTYHCLHYPKRKSTISYFVQYTNDYCDLLFGSIEYFFTYKGTSFALIRNYSSHKLFSDLFASSSTYHSLISKYINSYFYILQANGSSFHYIPIQKLLNKCIVFQKDTFIIVTPISEPYEHD